MNKKLIKLTEGDLKQIVKESIGRVINEAYGTPDSDTKSALDNLYTAQYYGDKEDLKHSNYYYPHKPYERLQHFRKSILEMEMDLSAVFRDDGIKSGDPYFYALSNHVQAMKEISERLIRKLKMEQGEQPDEDYNNRHLSRSQRNRKAANDLSNWKN